MKILLLLAWCVGVLAGSIALTSKLLGKQSAFPMWLTALCLAINTAAAVSELRRLGVPW